MSHLKLWLPLALQASLSCAQEQTQQKTDQKLQQLQQQLDDLKEKVAADRKHAATVTADYLHGFTIGSNDGNFVLHIGADLQFDNLKYTGAGSAANVDTMVVRRARPTLYGTVYKYVDFFIRPDFAQGTTQLYDAYIQLTYIPWLHFRAGKFKPPVGLERLQNDDDTDFAERGLPSQLGPQRDIGFQVGADLFDHRLSYQLGVFNGVPDSSIGIDTAPGKHRDYAGRLFLTPVKGLGVGMGASSGNTDGEALPSYKTFGQQTFFTFASGVTPAGHRTRLAPQAYYYAGPFGILAEYALNKEGFQKGTVRKQIEFRAYQTEVSYILTGEQKSYRSPTPKRRWGAVELAVRLGAFDAADSIYTATTPRHVHEWDGGVNWYLNRLLRITGDYAHTSFDSKPPENVFITRLQINFGVL